MAGNGDYLINLTGRQVDAVLNKIHNNELVEKSSIDSTLTESDAPAESSIIGEKILDFLNNTLSIYEYDAASTYEAKDLCLYNNGLYVCVTDIEEPEAWTPAHWALTSLGDELGDIGKTLNLINHIIEKNSITPQELQQIATSRHAQDFLDVGDVIFIPWTDNSGVVPIKYEYPFVVADFVTAEDEAGNLYENAIVLQALYGVPYYMPFDAPEIIACSEGTTIESAYYYYTYTGGNFILIDPQPEAGSKVPTGSTYYRHFLSLATNQVIKHGLADYALSAYRQWLNSEAMTGFGWWHSMHSCDVSPENKIVNLPGFMNGFTEEWKAIFKPVKVRTKRSDAFNRETINVYDTFFLPSLPQLYGSQTNAALEGQPWQYWKDVTGLEGPANGASTNPNEGRKVPVVHDPSGSAHTMWIRTVNLSNPINEYSLKSGYLDYSAADRSYSSLPATILY